jgi:hypothetical protein
VLRVPFFNESILVGEKLGVAKLDNDCDALCFIAPFDTSLKHCNFCRSVFLKRCNGTYKLCHMLHMELFGG